MSVCPAKTQVRLGGCPGRFESSLGAQPHCWFCHVTAQICIKSDLKEILLKLAPNGQNDKAFLLTSDIGPKGLSAPALGLYASIKSFKK